MMILKKKVCQGFTVLLCFENIFIKYLKTNEFESKCKIYCSLSLFLSIDSFRWPHEAILLLCKAYTDNEHLFTNGKTHKKFWEVVSSQLIEYGYNVTAIQCKSKMAGLKNTYKNVKDHNAKSGNSRRTWRYLDVSRLSLV